MKTIVVIINGCAGSGKDEFVKCLQDRYRDEYDSCATDVVIYNMSSVDMIKSMLEDLGWDGSKTDDVRDLIAAMKQFWISNNNGPTQHLLTNILAIHSDYMLQNDSNVIFCHIREPQEIDKMVEALEGLQPIGIFYTTVVIHRTGVGTVATNSSDAEANIGNYNYDWYINNDGTIEGLREKAYQFMESLEKGDLYGDEIRGVEREDTESVAGTD